MESPFVLPIKKIGEANWVTNLQNYLRAYDIEAVGVPEEIISAQEKEIHTNFPLEVREYYKYFGATQSHDFMYGLKPMQELQLLFAANLSFVAFNFNLSEINTQVFCSHSPAGDPLCFDQKSGAIYLFSHDPIQKARVFSSFNQYLLFELIETEKLVGAGLTAAQEQQLKTDYLSGEGIDYEFRRLKL